MPGLTLLVASFQDEEGTPGECDYADRTAPMGEATTRFEERTLCPLGKGVHEPPVFEDNKALCGAGILFMLPSLLAQGLLKAKEVFRLPASHYYGLDGKTLNMYVCRGNK